MKACHQIVIYYCHFYDGRLSVLLERLMLQCLCVFSKRRNLKMNYCSWSGGGGCLFPDCGTNSFRFDISSRSRCGLRFG